MNSSEVTLVTRLSSSLKNTDDLLRDSYDPVSTIFESPSVRKVNCFRCLHLSAHIGRDWFSDWHD
jgi:hypothetical protein